MEIKVKKEKEPELKLKKEAQVTVHKKNPILSAKEKKAAFTSKPVADLLGQRKKKEGAEKGKQPGQGREALFEKQKEKKKQAGKEAAIRGTAEDRKQNGKTKSTVSVPGTLQPDQMKQGAAPNSQPSAGFRAKEQYRREQAAKLAETKKSSLAKQTAIKGVRRGEAAILTQLEGGEEVKGSWGEEELYYNLSVNPVQGSDTFKADVAIRLQDVLAIQQLHVIQAWNGKTFVGMPQKNSAKGEREDIAHAVNAEFKADLESAIMDEYNKKMEYAKSQKQQRRGR